MRPQNKNLSALRAFMKIGHERAKLDSIIAKYGERETERLLFTSAVPRTAARAAGPLSIAAAERILKANGIRLIKQSAKKRDVQIILAGEGFVNGGGHVARRFTK